MANKLALEAGIGCRLLLKHPAVVWLIRHVAWLITRYNTGRDGCSPFRRIFGKPYNGSICKFGEQVHYKLSGHPSSRVEPRCELGAWVELTDEHLLGTLSGIRISRDDLSVAKESLLQQRCFGSYRGYSGESQTRRSCKGSTNQKNVHHSKMGG